MPAPACHGGRVPSCRGYRGRVSYNVLTSGAGGAAATGPGGARTQGTRAAGTGGVEGAGVVGPGAGGAEAVGAGVGGTGAGAIGAVDPCAGGTVRPRPYFNFFASAERREPVSSPVLLVRTARRIPRSCPPLVPGTYAKALFPSSIPLFVPLPPPPESSLPKVPDPESDRARALSPPVSRLLATAATDPSFESVAASALVAELLDFADASRLDYATAHVSESAFAGPPSVGGECALGTDVLEDKQKEFECLAAVVPRFTSMLLASEGDPDAPDIPTPHSYAEAIMGPYSSQWQAAMDAKMASWKSTDTYVDEVPPTGANIVDAMWIFRVKRPSGSPPAFKARYVARGFSQRHGVDYSQTFSPTPKMTTLRVLLHVAAQRDYKLHSLYSFFAGQPARGDLAVPTTWTTLAALGFAPSTEDPLLFLRTDTSLPPFYVLVYIDDLVFATADTEARTLVLKRFGFQFSSPQPTLLSTSHLLSAPPSDESVVPSGPYPELVGCLMYLMTCTRPDLAYPLSLLACYVALGRHRKVHWDAAKRVLRYLCSTSGMGLVLRRVQLFSPVMQTPPGLTTQIRSGRHRVTPSVLVLALCRGGVPACLRFLAPSEGLEFESQCVHFGHPSAGGCQRSTGDPRLILWKGYRLVGLGGYGRTDPLLNKPFYPNGQVWRRRDYERRGGSGRQLKLLADGATGATGTRVTGATGTLATGATGTRATGVTGSAARRAAGATDSRATGATGSRATGATGSRVTGATVSRATGAAGFMAANLLQPPPLSQNSRSHPLPHP
ncbi:unnamed protein product [Closterium sp. NIES-54]